MTTLQWIFDRSRRLPNGCMEFSKCVQGNGYGRATIARKTDYAHRHAYRIVFGEVPEGLDVCHKCDNRKCINPNHLFAGTRKDNMQDAVSKGRQAKGDMLPQSKLTDADKGAIVELAKRGIPYAEIAKQFSICRQHVGQIAISKGVRRNGIRK